MPQVVLRRQQQVALCYRFLMLRHFGVFCFQANLSKSQGVQPEVQVEDELELELRHERLRQRHGHRGDARGEPGATFNYNVLIKYFTTTTTLSTLLYSFIVQVTEVTFDGQEILQAPLTPGEHLTKQAAKIDFNALMMMDDDEEELEDDDEEEGKEEEEGDGGEEEANATKTAQESKSLTQQWPWENVRNHLRDALTEMSVLSDVVAVSTKECGKEPSGAPRRYMVLDGPVQAEEPKSKPYVSLLAKKRSLEAPASILQRGAEHLRSLQSDNAAYKHAQEFHVELLRLRQNWRLKKVSNTILGDLSYRTAGSTYKQSGIFEVVKSDDPLAASTSASSKEGTEEGQGAAAPTKSALKVNVPSELEDIAYIQVRIQKESDQLMVANLSDFSSPYGAPPPEMHWQKKLEAAQNVLFCKELFSQLAREAISLQAPIPHMVVGNQITASLFTDIQLIVSLCHSFSGATPSTSMSMAPDKKVGSAGDALQGGSHHHQHSGGGGGGGGTHGLPPQSQRDGHHSHVLEHSLHQLLRLQHSRNINPDHRALSSAPVGIPKRRRLAGPRAADRHSLLQMATEPTILEQVIAQAQHVVLRLRTMFVLDTMARELKDPLITCHWATLSSPTRTSVKVSIVTAGYDTILRTQLVIHVEEKRLTVICKEKGRVLHFSHEPQELRDFILCQICQHQINGVQALAK